MINSVKFRLLPAALLAATLSLSLGACAANPGALAPRVQGQVRGIGAA